MTGYAIYCYRYEAFFPVGQKAGLWHPRGYFKGGTFPRIYSKESYAKKALGEMYHRNDCDLEIIELEIVPKLSLKKKYPHGNRSLYPYQSIY